MRVDLKGEGCMTDWYEIVEYIHDSMEAVDGAHSASEKQKEDADHATLDVFREKLQQLHQRLGKLKTLLDNEQAFAMVELIDVLSQVYSDHRPKYRRTPHIKN